MDEPLPAIMPLSRPHTDTLSEMRRIKDLRLMVHHSSVRLEQLERCNSQKDVCLRHERACLDATRKEIARREQRLFLTEFDLI
jgi:hypothetical protein